MDPGMLVEGVLRSVLGGGRRKPSTRALRYLTRGSRSIWSQPNALLTAAGVAWGLYDTVTGGQAGQGGAAPPASTPPSAGVPPLPARDPAPGIPDEARRLVRLAIAAANADGVMNEQERAAVVRQATAAGVADVVEQELAARRPLADIVAGVTDPRARTTLYVLAYTILRADEQLTGAERIFLAQLAHRLGLDPAAAAQLERDTGERIDALGDQDQPGG